MGCFNAQCIASKMNIFSGDEIVVFPLYLNNPPPGYKNTIAVTFKDKQGNEFVVERDKVKPYTHGTSGTYSLGVPFEASYNDYGGYELTKKQTKQLGVKILLDTIKTYGVALNNKNCKESYRDDVESFDPQNLPEDISKALEYIHNKYWRGNLYVRRSERQLIPVHFCFMSKEIYDYMIKSQTANGNPFEKEIDEYVNETPLFFELETKYLNSFKLKQEDRMDFQSYFDLKFKRDENSLKFLRIGNDFECFHKKHAELSGLDFVSKEKKDLNRLLDENEYDYFWEEDKKEQYKKLLTSISHLYLINEYMGYVLNISWETLKTTGQEYSNKDIMEFQSFAKKVMKKKEKRFEE